MENFKDKKIFEKEAKFYTHTFSRLPVVIERGKGMYLWDVNGTKYLDMFAGIGVNSVGHCNKEVVKAIRKQAGILMHTSNWLYTIPQIELAEKLVKISGMEKVFFTNDGTEAVEAAIKLVRGERKKKLLLWNMIFTAEHLAH